MKHAKTRYSKKTNKGQTNLAMKHRCEVRVSTPKSLLPVGDLTSCLIQCYFEPHECPCQWHLIPFNGFSRVQEYDRPHTLCLRKNDTRKNDTDVTYYRFNPHQPISVIFGRDVAEGVCY